MNPETTINPSAPDIIYTQPQLTRQQRRHAKEAEEYQQAVAKQGRRLVMGLSHNPKGPRHIGAKQLAKQRQKSAHRRD